MTVGDLEAGDLFQYKGQRRPEIYAVCPASQQDGRDGAIKARQVAAFVRGDFTRRPGYWLYFASTLKVNTIRKDVCDGCNVKEPWEHRCHGDDAVVLGERVGGPCRCTDDVCLAASPSPNGEG